MYIALLITNVLSSLQFDNKAKPWPIHLKALIIRTFEKEIKNKETITNELVAEKIKEEDLIVMAQFRGTSLCKILPKIRDTVRNEIRKK